MTEQEAVKYNEMLQGEKAELLDALDCMVSQHCTNLKDFDIFESMCISANADAIILLAKYGRAEIIRGPMGRAVVAKRLERVK